MNIALIGYGKMGKEIEKIALSRGHKISLIVDINNVNTYTIEELSKADTAIEFSTPESAISNIYKCFEAKVPVVVGTTGWHSELDVVTKKCNESNSALFHTTNFSIGVNVFFKLNQQLAKLMKPQTDYKVEMEEIHHIHKLDSPSGTAITLADKIMGEMDNKKKWVNEETQNPEEIGIISKRINEVPGTHTVTYSSDIDLISVTHLAHNRKGFALGAVIAAEFIKGKEGIFGMDDMMNFN